MNNLWGTTAPFFSILRIICILQAWTNSRAAHFCTGRLPHPCSTEKSYLGGVEWQGLDIGFILFYKFTFTERPSCFFFKNSLSDLFVSVSFLWDLKPDLKIFIFSRLRTKNASTFGFLKSFFFVFHLLLFFLRSFQNLFVLLLMLLIYLFFITFIIFSSYEKKILH